VKRGPEAEHSFAAADLKHCLFAEIYVAKELLGKTREIKAVVPQSHFLAKLSKALGRRNRQRLGWNALIDG
jgi:hypothetical protein